MAVLTSSNVRVISAWTSGALASKRQIVRRVEVHGGSWGGATNTMPATAFGLRVVEEVTPMNYSDKNYPAVPKTDGSVVYLYATVGGSSSPADVTVAATPSGGYLTVKGY